MHKDVRRGSHFSKLNKLAASSTSPTPTLDGGEVALGDLVVATSSS
jgi:hypothetical protein